VERRVRDALPRVPDMLARAILGAMHLVAAVSSDPDLAHQLREFRDGAQRFLIHPVPAGPLLAILDAMRALDFAGALLLDPRLQREAARTVERVSLEVRELGAADAVVLTPAGVVADLHLGRAVGAALRHRLWNARGARAVVLGADLTARAVARELGTLGVAHLAVLASERPDAERVVAHLAATTDVAARADNDPAALPLLERADLVVRTAAGRDLPAHVLGPHLALVDAMPGSLTAWRRRGLEVGALTIGRRDIEAHRLHLALGAILGPGVALEPFMALLHEA
jgi:hypothetical protein